MQRSAEFYCVRFKASKSLIRTRPIYKVGLDIGVDSSKLSKKPKTRYNYVTREDTQHIWRVKYIKGDMFHGRNAGGHIMDLYCKDYRPATDEEIEQYEAFGTRKLGKWDYVHDRSTRTTWKIKFCADSYCDVTDFCGRTDQLLWDILRCATPIEIKQFKRG